MPSYVTPRKNSAFIVYVSLEDQANAGLFKTSPTLAAGDVKVSIDGGALTNLATLPTNTPSGSAMVKLSLSADEMNGDNITVVCKDAAGAEWYDLVLNIQTSARQIDDLAATGADGDTLETLSDQIDALALEATAQAILEDTGTTLPALISAISQTVNSTTDSTTAGAITRRRGDSWSIALTLGAITGYTSLWFTIKSSYDDLDSASLLHVKLNASTLLDGLLYVNGAAATSEALASITVSDAGTGAIIVAVDETVTDDLAPGSYYYDAQALIAGAVTTPDSGVFTITSDVTRSVV